ncbi:MAG: class I SAM-dependent methyltransferase [Halanaerobiales bacterium]
MADFWQGVEFSHLIIKQHIREGSVVVDATAGNGQDTVFLAELVGRNGKVFAFDIQKKAIDNTGYRLEKKNLLERVKLINDGHQNLHKYLTEEVNGVLFNLGYLPGGDKEITTEKQTTITAIEKSLKILEKGGIIVLVIYTGHPGGSEELKGILELLAVLDSHEFNVLRYNFINQESPPEVVAVIRR